MIYTRRFKVKVNNLNHYLIQVSEELDELLNDLDGYTCFWQIQITSSEPSKT